MFEAFILEKLSTLFPLCPEIFSLDLPPGWFLFFKYHPLRETWPDLHI
jgi:hypothetical protein